MQLADATVVQSRYSLEKHAELGLELRSPVVIPNAPDPEIFHPPAARERARGQTSARDRDQLVGQSAEGRRRARSGSTAHLDVDQLEVTFAGRTADEVRTNPRRRDRSPSERARRAAARAGRLSRARAVTTRARTRCSRHLPAGLPAAFLRSGGHPELVGDGGARLRRRRRSFRSVFARLRRELDERRAAIRVPALADVADRYLEVLRG